MENENKSRMREQRNKRTSYVLMVVFGVVMILGVAFMWLGVLVQLTM